MLFLQRFFSFCVVDSVFVVVAVPDILPDSQKPLPQVVRANPVVRGFPLREEGQVELLGRRLTDLAQTQNTEAVMTLYSQASPNSYVGHRLRANRVADS